MVSWMHNAGVFCRLADPGRLPRRRFLCDGSGCGSFKVLERIVGRGGSSFSRAISARSCLFSARNSSMIRNRLSTRGVRCSGGTSMPAILIGSAPSMPHKKHPNRPPSKDQFHGVIEKLHRHPSSMDGSLAYLERLASPMTLPGVPEPTG